MLGFFFFGIPPASVLIEKVSALFTSKKSFLSLYEDNDISG
jgi:hypothetical protein